MTKTSRPALLLAFVLSAALLLGLAAPPLAAAARPTSITKALDYISAQPAAIIRYLQISFWPSNLCLDLNWSRPERVGWMLVPAMFMLPLALGAAVLLLAVRPGYGFWAAWFFIVLVPTSSFIVIMELAFDHRVYLPLAGLAMLVVMAAYAGCSRLANVLRRGRPEAAGTAGSDPGTGPILAVVAAFGAIAILLGGLTISRNRLYASPELIWADAVANAPNSARARNNYGRELMENGKLAEAIEQFNEAIRLNKDFTHPWHNRGEARRRTVERNKSRWERDIRIHWLTMAIEDFTQAIKLDAGYADAYNGRGYAYIQLGQELAPWRAQAGRQFRFAEEDLSKAIELRKKNGDAYCNRGLCYFRMAERIGTPGQKLTRKEQAQRDELYAKALADLKLAEQLKPNLALTHLVRGEIYMGMDRPDLAIAALNEALNKDPGFAPAVRNLSGVYGNAGDYHKALQYAERAISMDPSDALAFVNRGGALFHLGRYSDALKDCDRAIELDSDCVSAAQLKRQILNIMPQP